MSSASADGAAAPSQAIPSATVVLLREADAQLEVLMLQKTKSINYGGSWVFPGGVFDQEDYAQAELLYGNRSLESVAKISACRETMEEAGLSLSPNALDAFAHWTTPELLERRYATWFLVADARQLQQDVSIDHGEIVAYRWFRPSDAIALQASGEIRLNGPSFVALSQMAQFNSVDTTLDRYRTQAVEYFKPRGFVHEGGFTSLYEEDSDYLSESGPSESPDTAHRLYMYKRRAWQYVKS